MNIRAVDFVMLPVADLARAARFYRETLGLKQEIFSEEHQWAEFSTGNVTLALKGGDAPAPGPGMRIAFAVDDVPAACAQLRARGAAIVDGPTDFGCCQAAEIRDPDGHSLLLHHRADGTSG